MIYQFILDLIINKQLILQITVNETLSQSWVSNFGSGIGSGRVLASGVRVAKYPTRHSPTQDALSSPLLPNNDAYNNFVIDRIFVL